MRRNAHRRGSRASPARRSILPRPQFPPHFWRAERKSDGRVQAPKDVGAGGVGSPTTAAGEGSLRGQSPVAVHAPGVKTGYGGHVRDSEVGSRVRKTTSPHSAAADGGSRTAVAPPHRATAQRANRRDETQSKTRYVKSDQTGVRRASQQPPRADGLRKAASMGHDHRSPNGRRRGSTRVEDHDGGTLSDSPPQPQPQLPGIASNGSPYPRRRRHSQTSPAAASSPTSGHRSPNSAKHDISKPAIRAWKHKPVSKSKIRAPHRPPAVARRTGGAKAPRVVSHKVLPPRRTKYSDDAAMAGTEQSAALDSRPSTPPPPAAPAALRRSYERRSEGSAPFIRDDGRRSRRLSDVGGCPRATDVCDRCSSSGRSAPSFSSFDPATIVASTAKRLRQSDAAVATAAATAEASVAAAASATAAAVCSSGCDRRFRGRCDGRAPANANNNAKDRVKNVSLAVAEPDKDETARRRQPLPDARLLSRARSLPTAAAVPAAAMLPVARSQRSVDMENWLVWRISNPPNTVNKNPSWAPREYRAKKAKSATAAATAAAVAFVAPRQAVESSKADKPSWLAWRLRKHTSTINKNPVWAPPPPRWPDPARKTRSTTTGARAEQTRASGSTTSPGSAAAPRSPPPRGGAPRSGRGGAVTKTASLPGDSKKRESDGTSDGGPQQRESIASAVADHVDDEIHFARPPRRPPPPPSTPPVSASDALSSSSTSSSSGSSYLARLRTPSYSSSFTSAAASEDSQRDNQSSTPPAPAVLRPSSSLSESDRNRLDASIACSDGSSESNLYSREAVTGDACKLDRGTHVPTAAGGASADASPADAADAARSLAGTAAGAPDAHMSRSKAKGKAEDDEVVLNVVNSDNWQAQRPGEVAFGGPRADANGVKADEVVSALENGTVLLEPKKNEAGKRGSYDPNAGVGLLKADGTRAVRFSRTSTVISGDDNAVAEIRILDADAEKNAAGNSPVTEAGASAAPPAVAGAAQPPGSAAAAAAAGLLGPAQTNGASPRRVSICAGQDPIGYGMSSFLSTRDSLTIAAQRSSKKHLHADPEAEIRSRLTNLIQEILTGKMDAVKMTHLDNFAQKLVHADESEVIGKHVITADENIEIIGKPHHSCDDLTGAASAAQRTIAGSCVNDNDTEAARAAVTAAAAEKTSPAVAGRSSHERERGSGSVKQAAVGGGRASHRLTQGSVKFSDDMDETELIGCLRKLMSHIVYSPGGGSFVEAIEKIVVDVRTGFDDGYAYDAMILGICILQTYQELLGSRGQRGTFWKGSSADAGATRFERAARALVLAVFQEVTGGLSTGAYAMEDLVRIATLVSTCDHIDRSPASYRLAEGAADEGAPAPPPSEAEARTDEETCGALEAILRCLDCGSVTVKDMLEAAAVALTLQLDLANGPGGVAAGVRTQSSVVVSRLSGPPVFDERSSASIAGGGFSPTRLAPSGGGYADLGDLVEELRRFRNACTLRGDEFLCQSASLIRFALADLGSRLGRSGCGGDLVDLYSSIMCTAACGLYSQIKDGYKSNLDYKVLDRLAAQSMVEALRVAFRKLDEGWIQAGDALNLMHYVERWQLTSRRGRRGDNDADGAQSCERSCASGAGGGSHYRGGGCSSYLPPTRALMELLARAMEAMKTGCASAEELRNLARFVLTIYRGYLAGFDGPPLEAGAGSTSRNSAAFGGAAQQSLLVGGGGSVAGQTPTQHVVRQQIEKALHRLDSDSVSADDLLEHSTLIVRVMEGPLLLGSADGGLAAASLGDDALSGLEARIARLRLSCAASAAASRYAFMTSILERTADDVRYGRRVNFAHDAGLLCLCSFIAYEWATGVGGGGTTAAHETQLSALCGQPASELDSLACSAIRNTLLITLDKIRGGSAPLADLSYISGVIAATENLRGASEGQAAATAARAASRRLVQEQSGGGGTRMPSSPFGAQEMMDRVTQSSRSPDGAGGGGGTDAAEALDGMRTGALSSNAQELLHALLYSTAADRSVNQNPAVAAGSDRDSAQALQRQLAAAVTTGRRRDPDAAAADAALAYLAGRERQPRLPPLRLFDSNGGDSAPSTLQQRDSEPPMSSSPRGGGRGAPVAARLTTSATAGGRLLAIAQECEDIAASTPAVKSLLARLGGTLKELGESFALSQDDGNRRATVSPSVSQQHSSPARLNRIDASPRKAYADGRSPRATYATDMGSRLDESQQTDTAVACQTTSTRGILTEMMAKAALEKIRANMAEGKFTQEQLKALTEILGKLTDVQDLADTAENKIYMQKILKGMLLALQMLTQQPETADRLLDLFRNQGSPGAAGGVGGQLNRQMAYSEAYDLVIEGLRQYVYTVEQVRRLKGATEGRAVNLHPVIGRRPLNMNEEFLDEHLSAISIKPDGCKRYSYRSLIAPNIERLASTKDPQAPPVDMHERLSAISLAQLDNLKMSPLSEQEKHARRSSVIERRKSLSGDEDDGERGRAAGAALVEPRLSILEEEEPAVVTDAVKAAMQQRLAAAAAADNSAAADAADDDSEIHAHVIATVDFDETAAAAGTDASSAPIAAVAATGVTTAAVAAAAATSASPETAADEVNANNCNRHGADGRRQRRGSRSGVVALPPLLFDAGRATGGGKTTGRVKTARRQGKAARDEALQCRDCEGCALSDLEQPAGLADTVIGRPEAPRSARPEEEADGNDELHSLQLPRIAAAGPSDDEH